MDETYGPRSRFAPGWATPCRRMGRGCGEAGLCCMKPSVS